MAHSGRPRKCDPKLEDLRGNIRRNEFEIARQTLNEFGIDATDGDGRTALINSVIENKPDFIHWLVNNGANVNHQDRTGYSVLHFTGQNQLTELAKYFLDQGADPNLQDIHGNTPLWTAVFNSKENKEVTQLLLKFNANPDIKNKYGKTPGEMHHAIYNADISTVI